MMRYNLLNFELHRLGISYCRVAERIGVTESELILKLYGDIAFRIDEAAMISDLIGDSGGVKSIHHFFNVEAK